MTPCFLVSEPVTLPPALQAQLSSLTVQFLQDTAHPITTSEGAQTTSLNHTLSLSPLPRQPLLLNAIKVTTQPLEATHLLYDLQLATQVTFVPPLILHATDITITQPSSYQIKTQPSYQIIGNILQALLLAQGINCVFPISPHPVKFLTGLLSVKCI